MCGITGIFAFSKEDVDECALKEMTTLLSHRGPDDKGYYVKRSLGLGFRRLAIIDLDRRANQPLFNERGDLALVCNGEIYNYKPLREELLRKEHRFSTNSDVEVILHLYEEYGERCVDYLRGMFAFALWDERRQRLFLAKDRVGKKPLFYYVSKDVFLFASELKSLLCHPAFKRQINLVAISEYLTYGYVPSPLSIFKDTFKVEPGTYLIVSRRGILKRRYWDIKFASEYADFSFVRSNVQSLLADAVKLRLQADVPVGSFLSGGVDSSIVTALATKHLQGLQTFCVGFEEERYDESKYAEEVAAYLGTRHTTCVLKYEHLRLLPELVWYYNEPYADYSMLPSFFVSETASKHVKVVLNGDGGDENFAGYDRYVPASTLSYKKKLFHALASSVDLNYVLRFLPRRTQRLPLFRKIAFNIDNEHVTPFDDYLSRLVIFQEKDKKNLFIDPTIVQHDSSLRVKKFYQRYNNLDELSRRLYCDIKMYLPDDLLVKMDIATMANSIEARSPFLDQDVLEFASRISPQLKVRNNLRKYILKEAFASMLPPTIIKRKKMGFSIPFDIWLRNGFGEVIDRVIFEEPSFVAKIVDRRKVRLLLADRNSFYNWRHALTAWSLLSLDIWYKIYIENDDVRLQKLTLPSLDI